VAFLFFKLTFADQYSQIWDYDKASDYVISNTNNVSISGNGYIELSDYYYAMK
jgi:hypothetical protein